MEVERPEKRNIKKVIGYTFVGLFGVTGLSLAYSGAGLSDQQITASAPAAATSAVQPVPSTAAPTSRPTPAPQVFGTSLSLGSSGTAVANVQQFLADEGLYGGPDNGIYDEATYDAVVAFEDDQNITPANGVFGPSEQAAANIIIEGHPDWLTTLSNGTTYSNVNGSTVHSPAYSTNGAPAGASAVCGDGTYSFSMHHSGTCSHHGGVAQWLQ